ncbi:hypothetical protein HN747_04605 [archaeon]|jgi:hypothetical protein|nr:hypothetical protein [archaeon]
MVARTLYQELRRIEDFYAEGVESGILESGEINVDSIQRRVVKRYESNPILHEAIEGERGIEDSLSELAYKKRPVRRLFPIRKDKAHNQRLEYMSGLVDCPTSLKTGGLFGLDNFISGPIMIGAMSYGVASLIPAIVFGEGASPESQEAMKTAQQIFPPFMSITFGPVMGIALQGINPVLPVDEAKYLDQKVKEFYR